MRITLLFIGACLALVNESICQEINGVEYSPDVVVIEVPIEPVDLAELPEIFVTPEQMPEFPGGIRELYKYLGENLQYPEAAANKGVQGKVYVNFVVRKTGELTDLKILQGIGGGCDKEVIRLVESMPTWIPGKQNGELVNVRYTLPVNFYLR